jgi:DNA-binding IclR family transcriptional regulator
VSDTPAAMVDRVTLILSAFASRESQNLADIVARTGLPRSSVHRILQQLTAARWLERVDADYRLGLAIFELGSLVAHRSHIVAAARPFMQQLSESGRFVVHLAVLDGQDVVYLDKVGGALAGRLPSRVGGRLPAHCTGVGKAMLAHAPAKVLGEFLRVGLTPRTTATIVDPDAFTAELARIRRLGYAMDRGEAVPGLTCIAAPVFDVGVVEAAISVSGPARQVDITQVRHNVQYVATQISRRVTGSEWAPLPAS